MLSSKGGRRVASPKDAKDLTSRFRSAAWRIVTERKAVCPVGGDPEREAKNCPQPRKLSNTGNARGRVQRTNTPRKREDLEGTNS